MSNNLPLAHSLDGGLIKGWALSAGECVGFVGEDFDETRFNYYFV